MKHAFIMNCHAHLPQAARSTSLYRRYWRERSSVHFYYDGPREYDPELMEKIRENVDHCTIGPYEPHKTQSIFNAINYLIEYAASQQIDVVSFVHEDMIPVFRNHFYGFIDTFWRTGKYLSYSKMWPNLDFVDYCNLHCRVTEALSCKMFPIRRIAQNSNEVETTRSFDLTFPKWRQYIYPMWSITWPLTTTTKFHDWVPKRVVPVHPVADKTGHGPNGYFVFHNYIPESTMIHVNDDYFWDNYTCFSDVLTTDPR